MSSPQIIVSTVGTSLLTNQIDRQQEGDWFALLSKYANKQAAETPPEIQDRINTLSQRAKQKLSAGKLEDACKASAELNGIGGIYQKDLSQGKMIFITSLRQILPKAKQLPRLFGNIWWLMALWM